MGRWGQVGVSVILVFSLLGGDAFAGKNARRRRAAERARQAQQARDQQQTGAQGREEEDFEWPEDDGRANTSQTSDIALPGDPAYEAYVRRGGLGNGSPSTGDNLLFGQQLPASFLNGEASRPAQPQRRLSKAEKKRLAQEEQQRRANGSTSGKTPPTNGSANSANGGRGRNGAPAAQKTNGKPGPQKSVAAKPKEKAAAAPVAPAPPKSSRVQEAPEGLKRNVVPGEAAVSVSPLPDPTASHTEVAPNGLPPALDGFLVLLLYLSDIKDAPEYGKGNVKMSTSDKVQFFKTGVSLLVKIYGTRYRYPKDWEKIGSLNEFLAITEPTRGHSGSVSGDFRRLWYFAKKMEEGKLGEIPHSFEVEMPNSGRGDFKTETANYGAQGYRYEVSEGVRRMVGAAAMQVPRGRSLSIMDSVFRSLGTFLSRAPSTWGNLLRTMAGAIEGADVEIKRLAETDLRAEASLPDHLRKLAEYTDSITRLGDMEDKFMTFLEEVQQQDFASTAALIEAFEHSLKDIVDALRSLGSSIINSPQVRVVAQKQDQKHIYALLRVLFDDYPKLLPATIFKNIILDLFRSPDMTNDLDVLVVMLRHFGPILKNFLQTSSRFEAMNALARTFESLQTEANKSVPFQIIEMIIKEDPNEYNLTDINPKPLATGKFFQVHQAKMDGKPVIVRVMLPDSEVILEWELQILKRLAGPLAEIYLPPTVMDPEKKEAIMRKIIKSKHRNHKVELSLAATVIHQNAARERLQGQTTVVQTARGPVEQIIEVPYAYPALPHSTVMVCDAVENITPINDFANDHPDIARAAADFLTTSFYDGLIFDPLGSHDIDVEPPSREEAIAFLKRMNPARGAVEDVLEHDPAMINAADPHAGLAHNDPHGGNILPQIDDSGSQVKVSLHLIDWGLTSWVRHAELEAIAILGYGSEFNHATIITDSLMDLAVKEGHSRKELYSAILAKSNELERARTWWSPEEWIIHAWTNGYLEFPPYLISLADAKAALFDLRKQLSYEEEDTDRFIEKLFAEKGKIVIRRAWRQHPWNAIASGKVIGRYTKYRFFDCARSIAGKAKEVNPYGK